MTKIIEYTAKGKTLYKFNFYAGRDELTGKKMQVRRSGFKTKKEAQLALSRLEYKKESGEFEPLANRNITFETLALQFMDAKKASLRKSTYLVQKNMLNRILASLGNLKMKNIRGYHCQNAVNRWSKKAPATVSNIKILANQVFEYAIKNGYITKNPMDAVIMPKKPAKKRENNYYTKQELNEFLTFVKQDRPSLYPLFRLLAYSGMRIGELLALTWDDIDLEASTVSITKTLSRVNDEGRTTIEDTKTKAGRRTISLDATTINILASYKQEQSKRLFSLGILNTLPKPLIVFDRGIGSSYSKAQGERFVRVSDIRRYLNSMYKRMPKDFKHITLHGFRHTHATLLIESGANIKAVQQRLGHANINMTLGIYAHATKIMENDAINGLSLYMEN